MIAWEERPVEIAHLLNPAFCSLVLQDAAYGYGTIQEQGLPYALAFLILPVALHTPSRELLPRRVTNVPLHEWLDVNPQSKIGFSLRVHRLGPFTREAIIFGVQKQAITLSLEGYLQCSHSSPHPTSWPEDSETVKCLQAAYLIGQWFALTGEVSTVFRLWGIRP